MGFLKLISTVVLFYSFQSAYAQGKDSINIKDADGFKQGHWVLFGESKPKSCYKPNQKVAEGNYKDNRKDGVWIEYFCNDRVKNTLEFKEGRPNGKCVTYHENGTINETGIWLVNKWIGEYVLFFETGKPQQIFTFNEKGQRDGLQKYYYRNGILQVISTYKENKGYASIEFDTLGKLVTTGLNGKAIKENDEISNEDKKIIDSMRDIAAKENKPISSPKEPQKKKVITKSEIQDINFNRKEIQKSN